MRQCYFAVAAAMPVMSCTGLRLATNIRMRQFDPSRASHYIA
jgi:hypothetical protein